MSRFRTVLLTAGVVAAAAPASALGATATSSPDLGVVAGFTREGITVTVGSPARLSIRGGRATVTQPVSNVRVNRRGTRGTVDIRGTYNFRRGRKAAVFSGLRLDVGKNIVKGNIGGKRLTLASFSGVTRSGSSYKAARYALTGEAAAAIRSRVGGRFARGGLVLVKNINVPLR